MTTQAQQRWLTGLSAVPCLVAGLSTALIPYNAIDGDVIDLKIHWSATLGCFVAAVLALLLAVIRAGVRRRELSPRDFRWSVIFPSTANLLMLALLATIVANIGRFDGGNAGAHQLLSDILAMLLCISIIVHVRSVARVSAGNTYQSRWALVARAGTEICLYAPLSFVVALSPFSLCFAPFLILLIFFVMAMGLFMISLAGVMGHD